MFGVSLSPRIARELNIRLVALYEEGAVDARIALDWPGFVSDPSILFTPETSDTRENVYVFAAREFDMQDQLPGTDEIEISELLMYEYRLGNKRKRKTFSVDLDAWNDDRIGEYKQVFYRLGGASAKAKPRRMVETIKAARTALCYTGKALVANDHPLKPGSSTTWSNILVAAGGPTETNFAALLLKMLEIPGEDGWKIGAQPTHVVTGPTYLGAILDRIKNPLPSTLSGAMSQWLNMMQLIVLPDLTAADGWGFVDARMAKELPFIIQEREEIRLIQITDPQSPTVALHNKAIYTNTGRFNCGNAHPQRIAWNYPS